MSEIQPPVTVLDHAGTLEDPIEVDAIFRDENDKIYKLGGGSGGGDNVVIAPATDQTLGIVKLTDDPNLEASAAKDFTAITPNGVRALKTEIDGKIEQVEQAARELANGATSQASSVQELSATIAEITRHISDTAEYSRQADVTKLANIVSSRSPQIQISATLWPKQTLMPIRGA